MKSDIIWPSLYLLIIIILNMQRPEAKGASFCAFMPILLRNLDLKEVISFTRGASFPLSPSATYSSKEEDDDVIGPSDFPL